MSLTKTGAKQERFPWTAWKDGRNRKILIVRLGSLGDIIHAIPAQQSLCSQLPGVEIHWLTEPPYAELLGNIPGIAKVWIADTKSWRNKFSSFLESRGIFRKLRQERYDVVFDFQGLLKSALLSRLSGSACVAGFAKPWLREKAACYFYTHPVELEVGNKHQVEVCLDLINPPLHTGSADADIHLRVPDNVNAYIEHQLDRLGITEPVLLNPGAGWSTKRWAIERFARLADLIETNLQIPVLFTYGPGEESLIDEAAQAMKSEKLRSFPTSILELAALCSRSRLMVAGDTGPMHLAVAMNTSTVALIGPGYSWRTGPFNPLDQTVQHERPCPTPYKRSCRNHFCMDIRVEEVYRAVVTRLSRKGG